MGARDREQHGFKQRAEEGDEQCDGQVCDEEDHGSVSMLDFSFQSFSMRWVKDGVLGRSVPQAMRRSIMPW